MFYHIKHCYKLYVNLSITFTSETIAAMSFGIGIGDVVIVIKLTRDIYQFCYTVSSGAPIEYGLLLQQLASLSQSVQLLKLELKNPTSTLMSSGPDRVQMVGEMC